jgi:hypothetical protein
MIGRSGRLWLGRAEARAGITRAAGWFCMHDCRAHHHDHPGRSAHRGQRGRPEAGRVGPRDALGRDRVAGPYYIPREDVRTELLRPARRKTTCPFKGQASYWPAQVGGELYEDLIWSYETPIPAAQQIAGLMCFYNERVELTISDQHRQDPRASSFR